MTASRLAEPIRDVSRYHIRLDVAHKLLLRVCLGGLLRLRFNEGYVNDFSMAHYAARHWPNHYRFGDVSSYVKDAIRCLFDIDKPHFAIWINLMFEPYFGRDIPLYYVSYLGFYDVAEHIIAQHPEQVDAKGRCNRTPLHAAAMEGHIDTLSLLLKHGADVEARDVMDHTPLHHASASPRGNLEAGRRLLDHGADINPRGFRNLTPVCAAVVKGHVEFARMLLERGAAMDIRAEMDAGRTPLTEAVYSRKIQMVRLLLEYGEDVNERDGLGRTPSQWASIDKQQDIVELLSEYGAESVE